MKKTLIVLLFLFGITLWSNDVVAIPGSCDLSPEFCLEQGGDDGAPSPIPLPETFTYDYYGDIASIDTNGEAFYRGDYSVAQWEYDYSQLRMIGTRIGMRDIDLNSMVLPTFHHPSLGNTDLYLVYKTQIIKYDPTLYEHFEYLILTYQAALDDLEVWHTEVADQKLDELINYVFNVDMFVDLIKGDVTDQTCNLINMDNENHEKLMKLACKKLVPKVIDKTEAEIRQYLAEEDIIDLIPEEEQHDASYMVFQFIYNKIRSIPGVSQVYFAADVFAYLALIYHHTEQAQMCADISSSIDDLLPMFQSEFEEQNIRLDYVIYNSHRHTVWDVDTADPESYRSYFESWTTHIFFSVSTTDKLVQNMYPVSRVDSHYFNSGGIRGTLSVERSTVFLEDLENLLDSRASNDPIATVGVINPYRTGDFGAQERLLNTTDFNMYTTHQSASPAPVLDTSEAMIESIHSTGFTLRIQHDAPDDNLIKTEVVLYDDAGVLESETLLDAAALNGLVTFSGLIKDTPYYVEIFTYYHDANSYQTLIAKHGIIVTPVDPRPSLNTTSSRVAELTDDSVTFSIRMNDPFDTLYQVRIYLYTSSGQYVTYRTVYSSQWNGTPITISGLNEGTTYKYRVYVRYFDGSYIRSFYAETAYFTTLVPTPPSGGGGGGTLELAAP